MLLLVVVLPMLLQPCCITCRAAATVVAGGWCGVHSCMKLRQACIPVVHDCAGVDRQRCCIAQLSNISRTNRHVLVPACKRSLRHIRCVRKVFLQRVQCQHTPSHFAFSAAAADFGFQLRWSKHMPNGPMNPSRGFLGFPSSVVTTE